jgi:5S rRNA maturation endonuclease (ribonuclease M5)
MAKIENSIKPPHYFNTLELTLDWKGGKPHEKQYYKGLRKQKTIDKIHTIIDSLTTRNETKKYWKTFHCNTILLQQGNSFKGSLCRKRWCTECCRIKTAELTNAYKEPIKELGAIYFVTLTTPNVKGEKLNKQIKRMIKAFQLIKNNIRNTYKIKLQGIRKIEVTYNEIENTYHPHFHLIQDNAIASDLVLSLWLNQFPNAKSVAQDVRKIDTTNENSFIELFKYATKETTKEGKQYSGEVLHTIYSSIEGLRIYQTYGAIKKVKQPIEKQIEQTTFVHIPEQNEIWQYNNQLDWETANGQLLTNAIEIQKQLKINKEYNLIKQN